MALAVLDARDDKGVAADGARNVAEFVSHPGLLAMIGPFDSEVARAAIPLANQAHLAVVSPATSSRCLTKEPFLPAGLNPLRTAITCRAAGLPSPADLRPSGVNNSRADRARGQAASAASARVKTLSAAAQSRRNGAPWPL